MPHQVPQEMQSRSRICTELLRQADVPPNCFQWMPASHGPSSKVDFAKTGLQQDSCSCALAPVRFEAHFVQLVDSQGLGPVAQLRSAELTKTCLMELCP